jgi:hypothetical protein
METIFYIVKFYYLNFIILYKKPLACQVFLLKIKGLETVEVKAGFWVRNKKSGFN